MRFKEFSQPVKESLVGQSSPVPKKQKKSTAQKKIEDLCKKDK